MWLAVGMAGSAAALLAMTWPRLMRPAVSRGWDIPVLVMLGCRGRGQTWRVTWILAMVVRMTVLIALLIAVLIFMIGWVLA